MKPASVLLIAAALCLISQAQVTTTTIRKPSVRAVGDATVMSTPDQAIVTFTVETRAGTAQDAGSQNAAQTSAVLAALQKLITTPGAIQTINYSLAPQYTYPPGGGQGSLTGYIASNTVQVTIANLTLVGTVIDTGTQAGANNVQGLSFSLKDPEPVRLQALRLAAAKARTHADAMVGGAGLHLGNVISMIEGVASTPIMYQSLGAVTAAVPTPINPGSVNITATVTMELEIVP